MNQSTMVNTERLNQESFAPRTQVVNTSLALLQNPEPGHRVMTLQWLHCLSRKSARIWLYNKEDRLFGYHTTSKGTTNAEFHSKSQ